MSLAVDVQHADHGGGMRVLADGRVDLVHQPVEQARVDGLRQRVAVVRRRCHIDGAHDRACVTPIATDSV